MNVESTFHYPIAIYGKCGYTKIFHPVECDEIIRLGHLHELNRPLSMVTNPDCRLILCVAVESAQYAMCQIRPGSMTE